MNARRACELVRDLLADLGDHPRLAEVVRECEDKGDRLAHVILRRVAVRGERACALDSTDVHALAGAVDDVVDFAEEAADQLGLYGVSAGRRSTTRSRRRSTPARRWRTSSGHQPQAGARAPVALTRR